MVWEKIPPKKISFLCVFLICLFVLYVFSGKMEGGVMKTGKGIEEYQWYICNSLEILQFWSKGIDMILSSCP